MTKIAIATATLIVAVASLAQAADYKPMKLPTIPAAPTQPLPLGAQVTSNGVYVPVTKSGNVGIHAQGLPNPAPGEKGGAVGITIKTK